MQRQRLMNTSEAATKVRLRPRSLGIAAPSLAPATAVQLKRAAILLPVLGTALGTSLARSRSPQARRWGLATLGVSLGSALARWQLGRLFTWQPKYKLEFEYGRLQIRTYEHQIQAETTVEGARWSEALNEGFLRLAAFISGDNHEQRSIAMTAPVMSTITLGRTLRGVSDSWKPPRVSDVQDLTGRTARNVAFVLPGNTTLDELPTPNDARVHLHGVPPRRMAVLGFHGSYSGELPAQKRNELLFLLKCAGLRAASEVWFAAYDGPSTLPLLRKNEVMVEIAD
jgi:hypothetical protein